MTFSASEPRALQSADFALDAPLELDCVWQRTLGLSFFGATKMAAKCGVGVWKRPAWGGYKTTLARLDLVSG